MRRLVETQKPSVLSFSHDGSSFIWHNITSWQAIFWQCKTQENSGRFHSHVKMKQSNYCLAKILCGGYQLLFNEEHMLDFQEIPLSDLVWLGQRTFHTWLVSSFTGPKMGCCTYQSSLTLEPLKIKYSLISTCNYAHWNVTCGWNCNMGLIAKAMS